MSKIDWALFRKQKLMLQELSKQQPELEGVINLYDHLQDEAVASGLATELEVFGNSELTSTELKELIERFVESQDDNSSDEWCGTDRDFAKASMENFVTFLKERGGVRI